MGVRGWDRLWGQKVRLSSQALPGRQCIGTERSSDDVHLTKLTKSALPKGFISQLLNLAAYCQRYPHSQESIVSLWCGSHPSDPCNIPASPSRDRRGSLECWGFTHCHIIVPGEVEADSLCTFKKNAQRG